MAMKFGPRTKFLLSLYCLNFRSFVGLKPCCPCPLRKHPLLLPGGTPGQLYPLHPHHSPPKTWKHRRKIRSSPPGHRRVIKQHRPVASNILHSPNKQPLSSANLIESGYNGNETHLPLNVLQKQQTSFPENRQRNMSNRPGCIPASITEEEEGMSTPRPSLDRGAKGW